MSVPARISIVTLGVDDLARSKAFYQALGWELADEEGDEIRWFKTSDSYLGLFGREDLAKDAGLRSEPKAEFDGIALAIASRAKLRSMRRSPRPSPGSPDPEARGARGLGRVLRLHRGPGWTSMGDRPQSELPDRRRRPHHDLLSPLNDRDATTRCRVRTAPRPGRVRGSARSTPAP